MKNKAQSESRTMKGSISYVDCVVDTGSSFLEKAMKIKCRVLCLTAYANSESEM